MPVHSEIAENCKTDELARLCTSAPLAVALGRVGAPLTSCGSLMDGSALGQLGKHWSDRIIANRKVLLVKDESYEVRHGMGMGD